MHVDVSVYVCVCVFLGRFFPPSLDSGSERDTRWHTRESEQVIAYECVCMRFVAGS